MIRFWGCGTVVAPGTGMEPVYWSKRIGVVMVMAYGAWMLYGNVNRLVPVLAPQFVRQQREAERLRKLGGADLVQQLAEANAFGQAALAHMFLCTDHAHPWDRICQIGGGMDPARPGKVIPGGMKFGVVMDAERITRMSDLYPADGPDPSFSKSEAVPAGEPARERLPCGGPGYTATYVPATKFFGPALSVTFRVSQNVALQTLQASPAAFAQAADAALRTCIRLIESSMPLTKELPATAWTVGYEKNDIRVLGLPGGSEHLVYDPHTGHVRIWTERTSLTPPWR
jgi:hypothetical protein